MTQEEMKLEIARLMAENAALTKTKATSHMGLKVSAKGAVSLYGLGRFPITLYASQWESLLAKAETIKNFIDANRSALKTKETEVKAG